MNTILRISIGLAIVLALVVTGVLFWVTQVFDPNDYRGELVVQVKERSGRELNIEGDIGLSVFPWLGVSTGKVSLGNAPGFKAPVFAGAEQIAIRVKLLPLLGRKLEMSTITVHGLTLNLEKDEKGNTNWADLGGGKGSGSGASGSSTGESGGSALAALAIGGIDIREANFSYEDQQSGQAYGVQDLSLRTGPVVLGQPVDFEFGLAVAAAEPPTTGDIRGEGTLSLAAKGERLELTGFEVIGDFKGAALPDGEAKVSLDGDVVLDQGEQRLQVSLNLQALDLDLKSELTATGFPAEPKIDGQIALAEFNPRDLLKALGQELGTTDPNALKLAAVEVKLSGDTQGVAIRPLTLKIDESTVTGFLQVTNPAKPAINFEFSLDEMDLDRYLPPAPQEEQELGVTPGGAGAAASAELPLRAVRGLNLNGKLSAGKLKVTQLSVSDLGITVKAKDGVIHLNPMGAKLYGGDYRGNIRLDARGREPKISLKEVLKGIQAGPLLTDLQGKESLSGTADLDFELTAVGAHAEAIKNTLNGTIAFSFADGALAGVNIGKMIRQAKASLSGGKLSAQAQAEKTDFSELSGTVKIVNGIATNNDLSAKSPLLRIEGEGQADLLKDHVDYQLTTVLVATAQGQGGGELADLSGIPIPIRVTGSLNDPAYGLDVAALGKAIARSRVGDAAEQGLEKAKEKLGRELGGEATKGAKRLLEGLFKN